MLKGQPYGPCIECNSIWDNGLRYPPATIPKISKDLVAEFVKHYYSPEGTITDRIQYNYHKDTQHY
ncbi:MAG: hypothetical protein BAJALOKI1v1_520001 [Promethearchaeota archaeon]|nr:MAG: hypothetical protein BAJALOKI1v1_520001 [Candidatus Lokiarchaeota archaeon]